MKRIIIISCFIFVLTGCSISMERSDTEEEVFENLVLHEYTYDYTSAKSLTDALNNKVDVKNKIAKLLIRKVVKDEEDKNILATDSNLYLEPNCKINKNDFVSIKILDAKSKDDKWLLSYELIEVTKGPEEKNDKEENVDKEPVEPKEDTITMTFDATMYINKPKKEVEAELKKLGYSNIVYKIEYTEYSSNKDDTVSSITIDNKEFKNGDTFKKNSRIVISYWKYDKVKTSNDLAFIRSFKEYDIYFMFDTDKKRVTYFDTNGMLMTTTYSGSLSKGVTLNWGKYEKGWHEKFKMSGETGIVTDNDGFKIVYAKCDVEDAQEAYNIMKEKNK